MGVSFNGNFGQIFAQIDRLVLSMDKATQSFDRTQTEFGQLTKEFRNTASIDAFVKSLQTLQGTGATAFKNVASGLGNLIKAMQGLSTLNPGASKDLFDFLDKITAAVNKFSISDDAIKAANAISQTIRALQGAIKLAADLAKAAAAVDLTPVTKLLIDLGDAIRNGLPSGGTLDPAGMVNTVKAIVKIIGQLDDIVGRVNLGTVKQFSEVVDSLFRSMKAISAGLSFMPGTQQLDLFSSALQKIGSGLTRFNDFDQNAKKGVGLRTAAAYGAITASLKLVSSAVEGIPGGDQFNKLSVAIHNLGAGLSGITRFTKFADIGSILKLFKSIILISGALRLASKFAGDTKRLDSFALALKAVADFFNLLGTENKRNPKNFAEFRQAIQEVSNGFKELNKIDIDVQKVQAMAQAALAIAQLQKLQALGASAGKDSKGLLGGFKLPSFAPISVAKDFITAEWNKFVAGAVLNFAKGIATLQEKLGQSIKQMGDHIRQLGQNMIQTGDQLIQKFGLQNIFQSSAFQGAVEFQQLGSQLKVFGNLNDETLKKAQAFADEIGIKYPLSANQAEDAMVNLAKAGLSLNDIMAALPSAADLASISDSKSIDDSSKLLITLASVFKQFTADTAGGFANIQVGADIIAQAANRSTASVEDLQAGLANVGPTANSFGLTLQETAATLGILNDAGIRGAEAGTQLKSMLVNITSATPKVVDELSRLGVELTDSDGKFRSLNDIVTSLFKTMNEQKDVTISVIPGMNEGDKARLDAARKAFASASRQILVYQDGLNEAAVNASDTEGKVQEKIGKYQQIQENATRVIQELTGSQEVTQQITQTINRSQSENFATIQKLAGRYGQAGLAILLSNGADSIDNFVTEMNRLPTAAESAQLMLDNLSGDIEQLEGSAETLTKNGLLPMLNRAFRPLVQLGRKVVDFFNGLPQPVLNIAADILLLASTLATLVGGFLIISGVVFEFGGAILSIVGGLLLIGSNVFLVIGAITGFIASLGILIIVGTVITGVLGLISSAVEKVLSLIENNVGGAGDAFSQLKDSISGVFDVFGQLIGLAGQVAGFFFGDLFKQSDIQSGQKLADILKGISGDIDRLKGNLIDARTVLDTFFGFIKGSSDLADLTNLHQLFPGDKDIEARFNSIQSRYNLLFGLLKDNPLVKAILGDNASADDIQKFFDSIKLKIQDIGKGFANVGAGLVGLLFNQSGAKQQVTTGIMTLAGYALEALGSITGLNFSAALLDVKKGDFQGALTNFVQKLIAGLGTLLFKNQGAITDALMTIFNISTGAVVGGFSLIARFLGFNNIADDLAHLREGMAKGVRGLIGTIFSLLKGENLTTALIGNFGSAGSAPVRIILAIVKVIDKLIGGFKRLFSVLFPAGAGAAGGDNILTSALNSIANVLGFVADAIDPVINLLSGLLGIIGGVLGGVITLITATLPQIGTALTGLFSDDPKVRKAADALGKTLIENFGTGIKDALEGLNDVLKDPKKAFTDLLGADTVQNITDFFSSVNADNIGKIATSIGNFIISAVQSVPGLIAGLGGLIGSQFLIDLGNSFGAGAANSARGFSTGPSGGPLEVIKNGIVNLINGAVAGVPLAITNLGNSLGLPILNKIGVALQAQGPGAALSVITGSIAGTIMTALANVPKLVTGAGVTFGSQFLKDLGAALGQSPQEVINVLSTGVQNAFESALKVVGGLLHDAGVLLGSTFLINLGNDFNNANFGGVITTIANGLVSIISTAISQVPNALISVGNILGSTFLINLGNDLKNGTIGQEVLKSIGDGITAIIGLAADGLTFGANTGSNIVSGIGTFVTNVIVAAINAIVPDDIKKAITTIDLSSILLFTTGTFVDLDPVKFSLFSLFVDTLERLSKLAFSSVSDVLKSIGDIIQTAKDNPEAAKRLAEITAAISAIVIAKETVDRFKSFQDSLTLIGGIKPSTFDVIKTGFTGIKTTLAGFLPVIGTILLVGTAVLLIKNAIANVAEFLKTGNFAQFVSNTFAGMASDIASLFGLELSKDEIIQRIDTLVTQIEILFQGLGKRIAANLKSAFDFLAFSVQNAIQNISFKAGLLLAQTDVLGNLSGNPAEKAIEDVNTVFDNLSTTFTGDAFGITLQKLSDDVDNAMGDKLFGPLLAGLHAHAAEFFQLFAEQDLPDLAKNHAADWFNLVKLMVNSGAIGPAMDLIAQKYAKDNPDLMANFLSTIVAESHGGFDIAAALQTFILTQVKTGKVSVDVAAQVILNLAGIGGASGGLTEKQKADFLGELDQIKADLEKQAQIDVNAKVFLVSDEAHMNPDEAAKLKAAAAKAAKDAIGDTGIQTSLSLDNSNDKTTELIDQAQGQIDDVKEQFDATIPVEVTLPDFATSQDATDFADAVDAVRQKAEDANTAVGNLQTTIQNYVLDMANQALAATDTWTSYSTLFTSQTNGMDSSVSSVISRLGLLVLASIAAPVLTVVPLVLLGNLFVNFQNRSETAIQKVIDKLDALIRKAEDAANKINIATGSVGGTAGDQADGGRANGGQVKAGNLYKVIERGIGELYKAGNDTYLIPGRDGLIAPIQQTQAPAQLQQRPTRGAVNNFNGSPINVNVFIDGSGGNALETATKTAAAVRGVFTKDVNVRRALTVRGSSGI